MATIAVDLMNNLALFTAGPVLTLPHFFFVVSLVLLMIYLLDLISKLGGIVIGPEPDTNAPGSGMK